MGQARVHNTAKAWSGLTYKHILYIELEHPRRSASIFPALHTREYCWSIYIYLFFHTYRWVVRMNIDGLYYMFYLTNLNYSVAPG